MQVRRRCANPGTKETERRNSHKNIHLQISGRRNRNHSETLHWLHSVEAHADGQTDFELHGFASGGPDRQSAEDRVPQLPAVLHSPAGEGQRHRVLPLQGRPHQHHPGHHGCCLSLRAEKVRSPEGFQSVQDLLHVPLPDQADRQVAGREHAELG